MAYGTVSADIIQSSVPGVSLGAGDATMMKNRIINGAMVIDQRNAGASISPTNGGYCVDRWGTGASPSGKYTVQQNAGAVTPPAGFSNYLGATSTSAYSVGSTDAMTFYQPIEGFNIADLGWGTANAKTVTLSFWVRSSLTGTFGGALQGSSQAISYPFTYTISSANTWQQVSITVAGPTSGTFNTNNTVGAYVTFGFGVGSTYSASAGSWQVGTYFSATGATSVVGTNGATFYITGVQLEVGSSATGFEYRQYQQELALCQRYYWRNYDPSGTSAFIPCGTGYIFNTTTGTFQLSLPVTMRTRMATINFSNVRVYSAGNGAGGVVTSVSGIQSTNTVFQADVGVGSAIFAGGAPGALQGNNNTAAYAEFSAEL